MKTIRSFTLLRSATALGFIFIVSGCSLLGAAPPPWVAAVAGDGPGDPDLLRESAVIVENLPKSARGNPPVYSVFGKAYKVMDSAKDFKEWGVASWYGKKFHGRETSSGEIYDMHEFTAAHKSLPIPTFVRVTRLDSGKSIVVKVNDRGPFVDDRVIDLSYAAAAELDMIHSGKVDVYIEALSSHLPDQPIQTAAVIVQDAVREPVQELAQEPVQSVQASEVPIVAVAVDEWKPLSNTDLYIQVGAFSEQPNAERMLNLVRQVVLQPADIKQDRALHRVRIGPMANEATVQEALKSLVSAGIESYTLVSVNP